MLQDLVEELTKPQWYIDRKGEIPPGKQEYYQLPIFNYFKVAANSLFSGNLWNLVSS